MEKNFKRIISSCWLGFGVVEDEVGRISGYCYIVI